ncbi:hypothetical protein [Paraglaciecola sp.]
MIRSKIIGIAGGTGSVGQYLPFAVHSYRKNLGGDWGDFRVEVEVDVA